MGMKQLYFVQEEMALLTGWGVLNSQRMSVWELSTKSGACKFAMAYFKSNVIAWYKISIVKDYKQMQLTASINPTVYIADSNVANFEFVTQYQDLR